MHVAVGRAAVQPLLQAAFLSAAFFFVAFGGQHAHAGKKACPVPAQVSIADQQVEDQLNFQKEFMVQIDKVKARAAAVKAKVFGVASTGAAQAREVTKAGAGNAKAAAKTAASKAKEGAKEGAAAIQEKAAGVNAEELKRPEVFVPVSGFILLLIYLLWRGSGAATKVAATTPSTSTDGSGTSAPRKAAPAITPGSFVEAQSTRTNLTPAPNAALSVSALAAAIAKGEQEAKQRLAQEKLQAEREAAGAMARAERNMAAAQQRGEKEGEVERDRIAWEVAKLEAQQIKQKAEFEREMALAKVRVERAMAAAAKAEKEAAEAKVRSDRRSAAAAVAKAERDAFLAATAKAKAEREAAEVKARADKVAAVAAARPPRGESANELPSGRRSASLTGGNELPGVRNSVSLAGEAGFSVFAPADDGAVVRVGRSGSTTFAQGVRKYRAAVLTGAERERMAKMILGVTSAEAEGTKNITQFIANDLSAAMGQLFKNAMTPRK